MPYKVSDPPMIDVAVGRVLVASLHQGIADVLPARLDFYEGWLNTAGLRDGRIGLAPLAAVLSFLRKEGTPYGLVTTRAGECAAEWTEAELSGIRRQVIRRAPPGLRRRLVLRVARELVQDTYGGCAARVTWRRGQAVVDIDGSVFCAVRDRVEHPLCGFYRSAIVGLMARYGLDAEVATTSCKAVGDERCVITVDGTRRAS